MVECWLAIDPGHATGWSRWTLDGTGAPLERTAFGLVRGGVLGLLEGIDEMLEGVDLVVCEQFSLDSRTKVPNMEPMLIEGALIAECRRRGIEIVWQPNTAKRQVPDAALKAAGLWLTGKDVAWRDGDDVNDSARHAIAHALWIDHQPTARWIHPPQA